MAHYKRKKPRTQVTKGYSRNALRYRLTIEEYKIASKVRRWANKNPRYFDLTFNTPKHRTAVRMLTRSMVRDGEVYDYILPSHKIPRFFYY